MSGFHFFTEENKLVQNIQKFGPIDTANYSTTTKFTTTGACKAFACCTSKIIVIDGENPNLVNVILQPIFKSEIGLTPSLKYIIYRGIDRNDFMVSNSQSSSGYIMIDKTNALLTGTDFLKFHYNQLDRTFNNTLPSLDNLGYKVTTDQSIEKIFSNPNQIGIIKEGMCFGNFINNVAAIDFIVDENKFIPTIQYAEKNEFKITVPTIPPSSTAPGQESYDILSLREKIHGFIDPATYYNLHWKKGVRHSGSTAKIYKENIHTTLLSKFETKNSIYIDIRNNNDYSLNYYKDNQLSTFENFKLRINELDSENPDLANTVYYTQYWPILILDNLTKRTGYNYSFFDFQFFTNYNPEPYLYYDFAFRNSSVEYDNNVATIKDFNIPKGNKERLLELYIENGEQKSPERIIIPTNESNTLCNTWYIKLYILKNKNQQIPPQPLSCVQSDFELDNVFGDVAINLAGGIIFLYDFTVKTFKSLWRIGISKKFVPSVIKPLMVQTGAGISDSEVIFFALPLDKFTFSTNFYDYSNTEKNFQVKNFTTGVSKDADIKSAIGNILDINYSKRTLLNGDAILSIDDWNNQTNEIKNEDAFFFSLSMTRNEYFAIQNAISNPSAGSINTINHTINFGFTNLLNFNDTNYVYQESRVILKGMDSNGNYVKKNNIGALGQLSVLTENGLTFSTPSYASSSNGENRISNPDAIFSYTKLITLVMEIEYYYSSNTPEQNIAKLSNQYYGDLNNRFSLVTKAAFERTIPDSDDKEIYSPPPSIVAEYRNLNKISKASLAILTSHADENSIGDNPSPFFKDADQNKIDLGHLMFGLDGLIYNYADTGYNYKNFQITKSNDLTGYVADVFTAAAERRIFNQYGRQKLGRGKFYYPDIDDPNKFYDISASEPDLFGDIDPFGIYRDWKYFSVPINYTAYKLANGIDADTSLKLSFLLSYYYDLAYDAALPNKYPINANYKKRFFNFCVGYDGNGNLIDNPSANASNLVYQGFIEKNVALNKYEWAADNLNHISVEALRKRGETFAHFWYQKCINETYTGISLAVPYFYKLKSDELSKPVRFERPSQLSIIGDLINAINQFTL